MNERVIEIVSVLIRRLLRENAPVPAGPEIVEGLVREGYALSEIDAAFDLIYSVPDPGTPSRESFPRPSRVFSHPEMAKISREARDHLLTLYHLRLIGENEFEQVVVQLMNSEDPGLAELSQALLEAIDDRSRAAFLQPAQLSGEVAKN